MSHYICAWHDDRIVGEARNLYLNVYRGDAKASFRLIVCEACELELVGEWLPKALHRDSAGQWAYPMDGDSLESILEAPGALPAAFSRRNGP